MTTTPLPHSFRSPRARVLRLTVLLIVALALVLPATAAATVQPMLADMSGGDLSQFSQTNAMVGSLSVVPGGYGLPYAAKATYDGGGGNGYSRGIFDVNWQQGDDVWYGAAYYLPVGFHAAMQGQVAVLRWDNWASHPDDTDQGGIVINGGDKRSYLERDHESNGQWSQSEYAGPFDLPEGRWFWLEVHQHLSPVAGSVSEVYLDGQRIVYSTDQNMFGRPIERIRYGLVAIAESAQMNPLWLQFSRASVSTSELGPIAGFVPPGGGSTGAPTTNGGGGHTGGHKHKRRHRSAKLRGASSLTRCVRRANRHHSASKRARARRACYRQAARRRAGA
jgi:predicted RecA/RadA family phage recombinase